MVGNCALSDRSLWLVLVDLHRVKIYFALPLRAIVAGHSEPGDLAEPRISLIID